MSYQMNIRQVREWSFPIRPGSWRQWTPEMERLFLLVVYHLGGPHNATPLSVAQMMQVPGLTISNVTCYLTFYRMMVDNRFVIGGVQQYSIRFLQQNSSPAPPRYLGPPEDQHFVQPPPAQSPSVDGNEVPTTLTFTIMDHVGTSSQLDLNLSLGVAPESGDEDGGLDLSLSLSLPNVTAADIAEFEARGMDGQGEGSPSHEVITIDDDDDEDYDAFANDDAPLFP